jgi:hypothetical protein
VLTHAFTDWNVPKHLARFEWQRNPDNSTSVQVYPHDTAKNSSSIESSPSKAPFFRATFKKMRFAPPFPLSTSWSRFVGISTTLVHPPLPEGNGAEGELPGTDRWCSILPQQWSWRTRMGWFDMRQRDDDDGEDSKSEDGGEGGEGEEGGDGEGEGEEEEVPKEENFWPGVSRWRLGCMMEGATIEFPEPETWEDPDQMSRPNPS